MSTSRQDEDRERREVLERQQKSLSAALTEYDAAEDIGSKFRSEESLK
jgi:hypothetical protein